MRLRFLDLKAITTEFEGLLSEKEMNTLLQRRDTVLAYLDGLVQEQGYDKTVIH